MTTDAPPFAPGEPRETATAAAMPLSLAPTFAWSTVRPWLISVAALTAAFGLPLYQLARFALAHDLYSHVVLVPALSAYLVWRMRDKLPRLQVRRGWVGPVFVSVAAGSLVTLAWVSLPPIISNTPDGFALPTIAFLSLFAGLTAWQLGWSAIRTAAFPLGFLLFAVPLPTPWTDGMMRLLQHGSAWVAAAFFKMGGTPLFQNGLVFHLPGISLEIAPACSGIHSTLALFVTSVFAGYLFLASPWRRAILAAAVLPLALLRNGFRVYTIGELCIHWGPKMIDSPIHHHGGPLFFALSLVPFGLVLFVLARSERRLPRSAS